MQDEFALIRFILRLSPAAQEDHRRSLKIAGEQHPSTLMNKAEMVSLSASMYIAQVTVDASNYREAHASFTNTKVDCENKRTSIEQSHIANVQQAQGIMQQTDIMFISPCMALWTKTFVIG